VVKDIFARLLLALLFHIRSFHDTLSMVIRAFASHTNFDTNCYVLFCYALIYVFVVGFCIDRLIFISIAEKQRPSHSPKSPTRNNYNGSASKYCTQ